MTPSERLVQWLIDNMFAERFRGGDLPCAEDVADALCCDGWIDLAAVKNA